MDIRSKVATLNAKLSTLNASRARLTKEIDDLNKAASDAARGLNSNSSSSSSSSSSTSTSPAVLREKINTTKTALRNVNAKLEELNADRARENAQKDLESAAHATRELESTKNKLDAMLIRGRGHSELQVRVCSKIGSLILGFTLNN